MDTVIKKKIMKLRDKTLIAYTEFEELSDSCEFKGDHIKGIGCLCKFFGGGYGLTCNALHCTLV